MLSSLKQINILKMTPCKMTSPPLQVIKQAPNIHVSTAHMQLILTFNIKR